MTQEQIVVLLVDFFRDEYADDPKGVGYWFSQNYKGNIDEFLVEIDRLKLLKTPIIAKPSEQN